MTPFLSLESANLRRRRELRGIHREPLAGGQLPEKARATVAVAGEARELVHIGLRHSPSAGASVHSSTTLNRAMLQEAERRELLHTLYFPERMSISFEARHG
jgi:hypothetical protein